MNININNPEKVLDNDNNFNDIIKEIEREAVWLSNDVINEYEYAFMAIAAGED
jgi:hypothetical protein